MRPSATAASTRNAVHDGRTPHWVQGFRFACRRLRGHDHEQSQTARGELWLQINPLLFHYLRIHAPRFGGIPTQELEDLASQKSLELLQRFESGTLDLVDRDHAQLLAFFSGVARNGLMQLIRKAGHGSEPGTDETPDGSYGHWISKRSTFAPEARAEGREFAAALQECAGKLKERARRVWFFRVFYGMRSKDIAAHPEVQLKSSHVDVILRRARLSVRKCMQARGHDTMTIPPGVAARLWSLFQMPDNR